ncbi:MAG: NIPSNAP family protein [Rhizobiaceae bacterium]|jgi:hypothetical protein
MLYELRLYAIPPGRTADIEQRMLHDVQQLFAEHGMRVAGYWTVVAGPDMPAFLYILEWKGAAERDACWRNFYADQRWWDIRARTNAGSELVEDYGLWLMKPNAALKRPFPPVTARAQGEIHEMLLQFVAIGQGDAVASHLSQAVLPALEKAGGTTLAVLDMVAGPRVPAVAIFMAWTDFRSRSEGQMRMEELGTGGLLGRSDGYLLRPLTPSAPSPNHAGG